MDENVMIVFHGFLNLNSKEKMKMVGAMNDYFDAINREPIRAENEKSFKEINFVAASTVCKCCNR